MKTFPAYDDLAAATINIRWFLGLAVAASFTGPAWSQSISGEPWGARSPAQCSPLKQSKPPSTAQAVQLLRCAKEKGSMSNGELWLLENVAIEVGGPVPYVSMYPTLIMPAADTKKQVHPLRGSWTWSICILRADAGLRGDPNLNCQELGVVDATGGCWQTTFGDWKCNMGGGNSPNPRGPRTRPRA